MKNLSKAILIAFAVVIALGAAATVALSLYLQSSAMQARIQESLGKALRMPLKISKSHVSLGGQLSLSGISIPQGDDKFLDATSFHAQVDLPALLRGRLVVNDIVLESPQIVWPQNKAGKWELPTVERAAASSTAAPPPEKRAEDVAAKPKNDAPKSKRSLEVVVGPIRVQNGNIDLIDKEGVHVAKFEEVEMLYTSLTAERIQGNLHVKRLLWNEKVSFGDVRASFNYHQARLDVPSFVGTIGGGPFTATFKVDFASEKKPFSFAMKFEQVDFAQVARDAKWGEGQANGQLAGELELEGSYPRFLAGEGPVRLTLKDGRFQEFSYFEMIGQVLQIRQLSDLRLQNSQLTGRIADEKLHVENLTIEAPDLQITAKGMTRFEDGKLQLEARLTAQDALVQQLPGLVRDNFAAGENNSRHIDFNITGKTSKPKTDLLDKVVGKKIETQFDDLVNSLFGGGKKKDGEKSKDKKKKPEPAAAKGSDAETPSTREKTDSGQ